jgi:hypothetical protein
VPLELGCVMMGPRTRDSSYPPSTRLPGILSAADPMCRPKELEGILSWEYNAEERYCPVRLVSEND